MVSDDVYTYVEVPVDTTDGRKSMKAPLPPNDWIEKLLKKWIVARDASEGENKFTLLGYEDVKTLSKDIKELCPYAYLPDNYFSATSCRLGNQCRNQMQAEASGEFISEAKNSSMS